MAEYLKSGDELNASVWAQVAVEPADLRDLVTAVVLIAAGDMTLAAAKAHRLAGVLVGTR